MRAWLWGLRASSYTFLAMAPTAIVRSSFMGDSYPVPGPAHPVGGCASVERPPSAAQTGEVRSLAAAAAAALLASGCSATDEPGPEGRQAPPVSPSVSPSVSSSATGPGTGSAAPERPQAREGRVRMAPHPVSLPALAAQRYDGRDLQLVRETARTDAYTTHYVTYRSGDLTISGLMNVPDGPGPHPALVLAHGYIDPAVYENGQGLRREQDYLARAGYLTLHVDYRNHAGSDADPEAEARLRLGYTEDVVNAVLALRDRPRLVDADRVGLLGRSMGGGVVYNALVVRPELVAAAVVFAPVSSDTADNFDRWTRPDPGRSGLAAEIARRYGLPEDAPRFWRGVSPRTFFDRVQTPLQVHHGTSDDSCPIAWTYATVSALEQAGAPVRLHVYDGEEHAFGPQWPLSMERTVAFLDRRLGVR
jgi:dienelactone hydrolase